MTEQELDDVAFLTGKVTGSWCDVRRSEDSPNWYIYACGCLENYSKWKMNYWAATSSFVTGTENSNGRPPRDRNVAVCSQKRALLVTATVLGVLLGVALLIAYAGPQDCPCMGKMPKGYSSDGYNSSEKFEPYATNGQLFPWLLPFLPSNIKPNRYNILIHPNLTTFEVKGKQVKCAGNLLGRAEQRVNGCSSERMVWTTLLREQHALDTVPPFIAGPFQNVLLH